MKRPLTFIDDVFPVMITILNILRYSVVPVLFAVIGLIFSLPWQYYAITIGGYFAIVIITKSFRYWIVKILCKAAEASEKKKN